MFLGEVYFPRNPQPCRSSWFPLQSFCSLIAQLVRGASEANNLAGATRSREPRGLGCDCCAPTREHEAERTARAVPHPPVKATQPCREDLRRSDPSTALSWREGRSRAPRASSPGGEAALQRPPLRAQSAPKTPRQRISRAKCLSRHGFRLRISPASRSSG